MFFPSLDRLATIYLYHPLVKKLYPCKGVSIPILMYHGIAVNQGKKVYPYYETTTSPYIFEKHMRFLYENNYTVLNINEVIKAIKSPNHVLRSGRRSKLVAITFDDGFRDFYTDAFPILQKYGFTVTVFLPTDMINNQHTKFKEKEYLSWTEVQDLSSKGIIFGSHTVTHPKLILLQSTDIEYEVRYSKKTIEDKLGKSVESFSYPYAFPEENKEFRKYLRSILESSGYKNAVTTIIGTAKERDDRFFLKRIPINVYDDIPLFRAKIEGGYNWLHKPQYLYKLFSRLVKRSTMNHR